MTAGIDGSSPHTVPLGEGSPTREELLVYYPAKFTWEQLKTFVNSGDLGLLKRDKKLQQRYMRWAKEIKAEYKSIASPRLSSPVVTAKDGDLDSGKVILLDSGLPLIPPGTKPYFTADIPLQLVSIIMNDWPYSVPPSIEHYLIWTVLPILPPDIPSIIKPRILQDGIWGFTGHGANLLPPSPSLLPASLPALSDWGITEAALIRSPRGTEEEEAAVREAGLEVHKFIITTWKEREWETAWFVNPPRLQSVPSLAHIHVFARYKSPEERDIWDAETLR
ncbi:hypothetical protein B0F90DRAFT_1809160 [Multifurca ochricompacta]|uniref:Uncharacterized protein n=1 Tax=Multifurca ochricompacta TaxID=376703 RepID=A0AAD4QMJ9_9AGAM|nr:hypothetical protein B0F90DRAFT_1809160 [Multifurca ochricompacta]